MLGRNTASLFAQTDSDFVQTLLNDPDGRGIGWSYINMANYAPFLVGDYIWILDDDDECVNHTLIADLKAIVAESDPDVIMVRMDHGPRGILPEDCWQRKPQLGGIGCSAYIVKCHIWQTHSSAMRNGVYASDFDFISSIFDRDYEIYWFDCIASAVQRISLGEPE